jgi:D-cysteine desulfhydrase
MGEYAARAGIGSFPTPVEAAPELGRELGVPNLHIKREDAAGDSYGGNKIRKLDCLFGDALLQGCSEVFTSGGVGSNHVLATATYARELGFDVHAAQFPQPPTEHVRANLRALAGLEPTLTYVPREVLLPAYLVRARLRARFDDDRYYVPPGGSSPTGTLGFVEAAAELAEQVEAGELPAPDVVVLPASSGGTLAGLKIGFDIAGIDARLAGVRVVERYIANGFTVARLANQTASLIEDGPGPYRYRDIDLISGYLGEGYAEPTPAGERVTETAETFGLELDPTYTAKTVAGIAGEFDDETVLYWHTLSATRPPQLSRADAIDRLPAAYEQFL